MRRSGVLAGLLVVASACTVSGDGAGSTSIQSTVPQSSEPVATVSHPVVSTSTSPVLPVSLPSPMEGWRSTGSDPSVFGSVTITDAVVVDERVVAVGCATGGRSGLGFPVWVSGDGAEWERAGGPAEIGPVPIDCLTEVIATPFGIFAHGNGLVRSTDGRTWKPVEFLNADGYSVGYVDALFPTPDRLTVLIQRVSEGESTIATLLTTTNGTDWVEGSADSAALFNSSGVGDVLVTDEGLIAVGASPWGEFVPTAAVWTSADGLAWRLVTARTGGFEDAYTNAIVTTESGYLAVGGNPFGTGLMAAWASPDGNNWRRLPPPDEATDPNVAHMEATAISRPGTTIYAAGSDFDARRPVSLKEALWATNDGTTWQRVDLETLTDLIPFTIVGLGDNLIGFWPPPNWPKPEPVQVFTTDR